MTLPLSPPHPDHVLGRRIMPPKGVCRQSEACPELIDQKPKPDLAPARTDNHVNHSAGNLKLRRFRDEYLHFFHCDSLPVRECALAVHNMSLLNFDLTSNVWSAA